MIRRLKIVRRLLTAAIVGTIMGFGTPAAAGTSGTTQHFQLFDPGKAQNF